MGWGGKAGPVVIAVWVKMQSCRWRLRERAENQKKLKKVESKA